MNKRPNDKQLFSGTQSNGRHSILQQDKNKTHQNVKGEDVNILINLTVPQSSRGHW